MKLAAAALERIQLMEIRLVDAFGALPLAYLAERSDLHLLPGRMLRTFL
jgi:hypothetical protein